MKINVTVKEINFDMDGTFVNLYGVENWLPMLINHIATPYEIAKPLVNMSLFARTLNQLQRNGYKINVISWLAKDSTTEYDEMVTNAKMNWLKNHLPSVKFDNITIVEYGTPKQNLGQGILFDDEIANRENWIGQAFDVDDMIKTLRALL